jgi:hypothetical protein
MATNLTDFKNIFVEEPNLRIFGSIPDELETLPAPIRDRYNR